MTEHEILMLNSTQYINNAMYQVVVAISIFIAFRAARVSNESGASMLMKGLVTLFGIFVCFFNLQLAGWRGLFDQNEEQNRRTQNRRRDTVSWIAIPKKTSKAYEKV